MEKRKNKFCLVDFQFINTDFEIINLKSYNPLNQEHQANHLFFLFVKIYNSGIVNVRIAIVILIATLLNSIRWFPSWEVIDTSMFALKDVKEDISQPANHRMILVWTDPVLPSNHLSAKLNYIKEIDQSKKKKININEVENVHCFSWFFSFDLNSFSDLPCVSARYIFFSINRCIIKTTNRGSFIGMSATGSRISLSFRSIPSNEY